jgi:hypothetical protein
VDDRVFNTLPIHLLSLTTMKILSRNDIRTRLQPDITDLTERLWQLEGEKRDGEIKEMLTKKTSYAILSHRWLSKELTFQDMVSMKKECIGGGAEDRIKKWRDYMLRHVKDAKEAVDKVFQFCKLACQEEYHCEYVWFDTGCINKESSAELEESIRSMFKWYQGSEICIAYLRETTSAFTMRKDPWFTRGWTLQELLAPKKIKIFGRQIPDKTDDKTVQSEVEFFSQSWLPLTAEPNDKIQIPLWKIIAEITRIPEVELLNFEPGTINVRERMVWASKRKTTRIEDMAYCLIGIFNIPLSIAYGEGQMAFHRLQVEIVQRSHDRGLFAWSGSPSTHNSMFAAGPEAFFPLEGCLIPVGEESDSRVDPTYALTNYGLHIPLSIYNVQRIKPLGEDGGTWTYELEVSEGEEIEVAFEFEIPNATHAIGILGNIRGDTPLAIALILLEIGPRRYKRVITKDIITLESNMWQAPQKIFIE